MLLVELLDALPLDQWDGRALVIIWRHPAEQSDRWRPENLPKREGIEVIVENDRRSSLLATADFLITRHSTVAYEALYYGTPCISVGIDGDRLTDNIINRLG